MTETEIKTIVKEAVKETLLGLGVDADDPTEVQKDWAFLRNWRESTEAVKRQGLIAVVVTALVGLAGLVWMAMKG